MGLQKITDANCSKHPGSVENGTRGLANRRAPRVRTQADVGWDLVERRDRGGEGKTEKSNKVEVETPEQQAFEVVKEQKLAGETSYTKNEFWGSARSEAARSR